ncbi:MAG TPA: DUF1328 domain-containing protein [Isosphaeraceae bacterium]|jgi:uncharacterized membrane protein YtjA (UPF0391 family)|nr:DUF1328 domain-containing protein [Isosphaeraceae bacterium]
MQLESPKMDESLFSIVGVSVLRWSLAFAILVLIAGVTGLGGLAGEFAYISRILLFVFVGLLVVSLVLGRRGGPLSQKKPCGIWSSLGLNGRSNSRCRRQTSQRLAHLCTLVYLAPEHQIQGADHPGGQAPCPHRSNGRR